MNPKELIQKYYESLNHKSEDWKDLWADDATFSDASQTLHAQGKEAVINSFTQFLNGVEKVAIKQLIEEDQSVCAVVSYVYHNAKGETMSQDDAEVWEVKDGKLSKL